MHPGVFAAKEPDRPAVIMGAAGPLVTYAELEVVGALPTAPIPDECEGDVMLYSSGTTGRPKGIRRPVSGAAFGEHPDIPGHWLRELLGMAEGDVYLSSAPLYHAAPLAWSMASHRSGATVVVMERCRWLWCKRRLARRLARRRNWRTGWVPTAVRI